MSVMIFYRKQFRIHNVEKEWCGGNKQQANILSRSVLTGTSKNVTKPDSTYL
jgi:hypothetical protein